MKIEHHTFDEEDKHRGYQDHYHLDHFMYEFETKELVKYFYKSLKKLGVRTDIDVYCVDGFIGLGTLVGTGSSRFDFALYTVSKGERVETEEEAQRAAEKIRNNPNNKEFFDE